MQSRTLQIDISLADETLRVLPREWAEQPQTTAGMEYLEEQIFRQDMVGRLCRKIGDVLNRDALRERGHPGLLDELRSAGNLLYTELLGPELRKMLHATSADTLRLSLSGELLSIPWELLYDGEEFLSVRFHIGRVVRVPQAAPARPQRERPLPFRMLLLYDPAVDPDRSIRERILAVQRECNQFDELLSVDIEMLRMEYSALLSAFAQYDVFHCRSHIVADGVDSGWLLQDGQKFGVRDLNRVIESRIIMPVLTFSDGCESAKADVMSGEHLALAFLRAGVRHYLGTLCKIPPASSAYFTLAFYRALLDGLSVGAAISQARKALIANDDPRRLLWAGYVLYGDPSARVFSFDALLARQEHDPRKLLKQGIQLQQQGKWMQAMACYQQAEQCAREPQTHPSHADHEIFLHISYSSFRVGNEMGTTVSAH